MLSSVSWEYTPFLPLFHPGRPLFARLILCFASALMGWRGCVASTSIICVCLWFFTAAHGLRYSWCFFFLSASRARVVAPLSLDSAYSFFPYGCFFFLVSWQFNEYPHGIPHVSLYSSVVIPCASHICTDRLLYVLWHTRHSMRGMERYSLTSARVLNFWRTSVSSVIFSLHI